jgi:hypothetical protein
MSMQNSRWNTTVAFLRPSNLQRIPLNSISINPSSGILSFVVVAPKERRQQVRIVKPFTVHPHPNKRICPVHYLQSILSHSSYHQRDGNYLFIKQYQPSEPVRPSTISSWLRRLIKLSTNEPRVSVRSHKLGSSQALRQGISVEDIVTLGNWRSSETFHNHHRRERMSMVDFTTAVLNTASATVQITNIPEFDTEEDNDDAQEVLPDVSAVKIK